MSKLAKAAVPVVVGAAAFLVSACSGAPPGGVTTTTETIATITATTETLSVMTVEATTETVAVAVKVPDVSGMNHQDAQDAMQASGLRNLREVDSSGKNRAMTIDRNWCQTGQDPKPGTMVPADTVITLYADKC